MNCEQLNESLDDYLDGRLGPALRAEATLHLKACADCRSAASRLRRLWIELKSERAHSAGSHPEPIHPDATRRRRFDLLVEAWRIGAGESAAGASTRWWRRSIPLVVAALLGGLALGYTLPRKANEPVEPHVAQPPSVTPAPEEPGRSGDAQEFLLALRELPYSGPPVDPGVMRAVMDEYTAWADGMAAAELLQVSRRFSTQRATLRLKGNSVAADRSPPAQDEESMVALFIVRARNLEHAIELAHDSPHLRYGGSIDVIGVATSW